MPRLYARHERRRAPHDYSEPRSRRTSAGSVGQSRLAKIDTRYESGNLWTGAGEKRLRKSALPAIADRMEHEGLAIADETRLRIFEAISAITHMNCGEIVSMRGVTPA